MEKALEGKIILVTGATGGIGAAIVEQLAGHGAWPIIHYGRDKIGAEELLSRINGQGTILQADLSSGNGAFDLWRKAHEVHNRIHGLVNNAGIRTEISIEASSEEWKTAWTKEFQINFFAAADLSKEAIGHFKKFGGGHIINISSRAAQRGYVGEALPYGASKAALINLTKSIARSYGQDGVVSIAIAPGWVRTEMAEDFIATHGEAAAVADIPIGQMAMPSDVAQLVAFALQPSQASLNGSTIDFNGGSYIR